MNNYLATEAKLLFPNNRIIISYDNLLINAEDEFSAKLVYVDYLYNKYNKEIEDFIDFKIEKIE